jgi:hypothetical protein
MCCSPASRTACDRARSAVPTRKSSGVVMAVLGCRAPTQRSRGWLRTTQGTLHPGSAGCFGSRIGTSSSTVGGSSIGSLPGRSAGSLIGVSGPVGCGSGGSPGRRGAGFFGMIFQMRPHLSHQPHQCSWGRPVPCGGWYGEAETRAIAPDRDTNCVIACVPVSCAGARRERRSPATFHASFCRPSLSAAAAENRLPPPPRTGPPFQQ